MKTEVSSAAGTSLGHDQARLDLESVGRIASHDLKEPLRMIESFTGLLAEEVSDFDSPDVSLYASHIVGATRRMRRMVDNLLTISRLQGAASRSSVDLNVVLAHMAEDARRARPDVRVEVDPLPIVAGHPFYLSVLFANLVDNALRFNRSDVPAVVVTAEESGPDWSIRLSDNGVGIADEDRERVFEMFERVDEVVGGVAGTGIGLAVARRIARAHGGDLTLTSVPGEGTVISVLLLGDHHVE